MTTPKIYNIGIDARFFGTAASTGIGTYTEELIGHLLKLDPVNRYTIFAGAETIQFFPFYSPNLDKRVVTFPHFSLAEQIQFPRQLTAANLDIIHYTNFNTPILLRRIPSVVTIHDLTLLFFPGRRHRGWFKRWVYRLIIKQSCINATRVIAVSNATKADIVKYLGIPESKIDVVHEAVPARIQPVQDINKLEVVTSRYGIDKPFFLYVGQWRQHKNLVRLIRAFGLLRHRHQVDYQLVLVGKIDPLAPEVQATINQLGLQRQVVLAGYVADADLAHFYSAAESFVFPSLYEGFGIPPLEAMAAGTPVLASNVSVMPEVLGDAALYFDPYNIEDMAEKMYQVTASYHLRQQLKAKGAAQIKKYSFARMAKATFEVYKKVLK